MEDLLIVIPPVLLVIFFVHLLSKVFPKDEVWIARKLTHFITIPLAISYLFVESIYFFVANLFLSLYFLIRHLKKKYSIVQIPKNLGDVIYFLSWSLLSFIEKSIGFYIMLVMAIGDGVTGIVRRFYYNRKEKFKGIMGSIAMFLVCWYIGNFFFNPIVSLILSLVATLSEFFPEDNISIPLFTYLTYIFMMKFHHL